MMKEIWERLCSDPLPVLKQEIGKVLDQWREEHKAEGYWREPLVGVASARDPLFDELPRIVDPDHALPRDLLGDARSVIVFFLPFERRLGRENDATSPFSARSWAQAYVATNALIQDINRHIASLIESGGHQARITPATHNFDEKKLVSRWSHKHLAYIAGLGTFGVHQMLITTEGCCGRLGSLVTTMELPQTERPQAEWCLTKAGKPCLACVAKCAFGALKEDGFDRHACYSQLLKNDAHHSDMPLVDVCGKCACELPCSYRKPGKTPLR